MKRKLALLFIGLSMIAMLAACGEKKVQDDTWASYDSFEVYALGQGNTVFRFEATNNADKTVIWDISTDESTVGAALLAVGLIDGEVSDYGLMVVFVNGLKADFNEDGAYWAFYVDGDYAMSGADATDIEQGRTYAFIYTKT
ncbi:MAG: DUF4430 domain-containing protein [Oscillospiraceae bacterium]|nr:DUF4430 domain-containing protein [Oscillospiraceae bacterium]